MYRSDNIAPVLVLSLTAALMPSVFSGARAELKNGEFSQYVSICIGLWTGGKASGIIPSQMADARLDLLTRKMDERGYKIDLSTVIIMEDANNRYRYLPEADKIVIREKLDSCEGLYRGAVSSNN